MLKKTSLIIATLVLLGLVSAVYYFSKMDTEMNKELVLQKPESIVFSRGSSIRTLANQLLDKGLLKEKNYFLLWGEINQQSTRLQAGEYLISPGQTLAELLKDITKGNVIHHNVTLIEGYNFKQLLAAIKKNKVITFVLDNLSDEQIMEKLGYKGEHPEGRFYPDTYHVSRDMTDLDLLQRAYKTMQKILKSEWDKRENKLPFKTADEALIMASIVEKESAIAEERPLIAGLFINRLRKGMRLQTDPTVIYGIKNYDGNIRYKDLRKDTPYNTYTRSGLPPTPIAMPGREAIHATLHPDKTKYLYFVAYGDGSGRHQFSKNLKDHEKAVDKYQRKKK
jgi:UPF0755 protein